MLKETGCVGLGLSVTLTTKKYTEMLLILQKRWALKKLSEYRTVSARLHSL